MKIAKKILIIFIILAIVIFFEIFTNLKLKKSLDFLSEELSSIEVNLQADNAENEINEIKKNWKDKNDNLSLFVDHNELEKLEKNIILVEDNIKTERYEEASEKIAELKFMIEHIKEKNSLKLKNIF